MSTLQEGILYARLQAEKEVREAINGPTPTESLNELAESGGYYIQYYLVMMCSDDAFLEKLYLKNNDSEGIRHLIVSQKNLSEKLLMTACNDESERVILALLNRPDLTSEMVTIISKRNFSSKKIKRAVERAILRI